MKVRYRFIDSQVLEFFKLVEDIQPSLLSFPLDMVGIIQSFNNYRICSYESYAKKFKIPVEEVINNCQSDSGCTFYNRNNNAYAIAFNTTHPQGRQRWTLAHEVGHCFLNHFDKIDDSHIAENNIISIFNKTLECEADYFTAGVLAPFPLYQALNIQSDADIQTVFGLSVQASQNRYNSYLKWKEVHYKTSFDVDILRLFQPLISKQANKN